MCSNMELYQAGFVYIWLSLMALSRISRMSRVNIHLMAWRERTDKLSNGSGIWNVHPSIECCQNTRFTESRHARLACIAHPCHTLLSARIPPNTKWLAPEPLTILCKHKFYQPDSGKRQTLSDGKLEHTVSLSLSRFFSAKVSRRGLDRYRNFGIYECTLLMLYY